jgi:hypothetical protein
MVRIINCGVPPCGCHLEYGLVVDGSIIAKSQVFPDANLRQLAEQEARKQGQPFYLDDKGHKVACV